MVLVQIDRKKGEEEEVEQEDKEDEERKDVCLGVHQGSKVSLHVMPTGATAREHQQTGSGESRIRSSHISNSSRSAS